MHSPDVSFPGRAQKHLNDILSLKKPKPMLEKAWKIGKYLSSAAGIGTVLVGGGITAALVLSGPESWAFAGGVAAGTVAVAGIFFGASSHCSGRQKHFVEREKHFQQNKPLQRLVSDPHLSQAETVDALTKAGITIHKLDYSARSAGKRVDSYKKDFGEAFRQDFAAWSSNVQLISLYNAKIINEMIAKKETEDAKAYLKETIESSYFTEPDLDVDKMIAEIEACKYLSELSLPSNASQSLLEAAAKSLPADGKLSLCSIGFPRDGEPGKGVLDKYFVKDSKHFTYRRNDVPFSKGDETIVVFP